MISLFVNLSMLIRYLGLTSNTTSYFKCANLSLINSRCNSIFLSVEIFQPVDAWQYSFFHRVNRIYHSNGILSRRNMSGAVVCQTYYQTNFGNLNPINIHWLVLSRIFGRLTYVFFLSALSFHIKYISDTKITFSCISYCVLR